MSVRYDRDGRHLAISNEVFTVEASGTVIFGGLDGTAIQGCQIYVGARPGVPTLDELLEKSGWHKRWEVEE